MKQVVLIDGKNSRPCKCGCGRMVKGSYRRPPGNTRVQVLYVPGHWNRGKKKSKATIKRMSAAAQRRLNDPKYMANLLGAIRRRWQSNKPTNCELAVKAMLDDLGVKYQYQRYFGGRRPAIPDFVVPGCKLVIECDGDFWHSLPKQIARDAEKDSIYRSRGFSVLRLKSRVILRKPKLARRQLCRALKSVL